MQAYIHNSAILDHLSATRCSWRLALLRASRGHDTNQDESQHLSYLLGVTCLSGT